MRKTSSLVLVLLFVGLLVSGFSIPPVGAEPTTWVVDDDQPADFSTIGEAVAAASENDTILVRAGLYHEQVTITKFLILTAENELTILEGNGTGSAITVLSNHTQIYGFTIRNYTQGLMLGQTYNFETGGPAFANVTVEGNAITDCQIGITGYSLENPAIRDNTIKDCDTGLYFGTGSYHEPAGPVNGLLASGNSVSSNNIGLEVHWGHGLNRIIDNIFTNNTKGLWLNEGYDVLIEGNLITQSSDSAINAWSTYNGVSRANITANHILENNHGISIRMTNATGLIGNIRNNTIEKNSFGFFAYEVNPEEGPGHSVVRVYHNNFTFNGNQNSIPEENSEIQLDAGYPTGGNYWSDSNGIDRYSGVYQNETGADGISDFPIHGDNYPLIGVRRANPLAFFTISPSTHVLVGDVVTFDASGSINQDGNITRYEWDFGDGNTTSTALSIINHTYSLPDTYNVTLVETNDKDLTDSYSRSLIVQRLNGNISISVDRAVITARENVTIQGMLMPLRNQTNVFIWYKYGLEGWVFLSDAVTDLNSSYSLSWIPLRTGYYELKANWVGDKITLPCESAPTSFQCLNITSSITISTSSSTAYPGRRVNVTGTLKDMYGMALRSEDVAMFYSLTTTPSWVPIASDATNSRGGYWISWLPPSMGDFLIKVEWFGNATHTGSVRIVSFSTVAYGNQCLFTVESNSTLQGLTFDSSKRVLNFSVSGPGGSKGYARVMVAKSLVPNIYALKVRVDGFNYIYAVDDLGESWRLMFSYSQSVHFIIVDLLGNNTFAVTTPTFSPAGGSYSSGQLVTIQCTTPGATIRYTLDGSEPILSSPVYTGPIMVNSTTTIKAKAYLGGLDDSPVASAEYLFGSTGGELLTYAAVGVGAVGLVACIYWLMRSRSTKQHKVLDQKKWTGRKPS